MVETIWNQERGTCISMNWQCITPWNSRNKVMACGCLISSTRMVCICLASMSGYGSAVNSPSIIQSSIFGTCSYTNTIQYCIVKSFSGCDFGLRSIPFSTGSFLFSIPALNSQILRPCTSIALVHAWRRESSSKACPPTAAHLISSQLPVECIVNRLNFKIW